MASLPPREYNFSAAAISSGLLDDVDRQADSPAANNPSLYDLCGGRGFWGPTTLAWPLPLPRLLLLSADIMQGDWGKKKGN